MGNVRSKETEEIRRKKLAKKQIHVKVSANQSAAVLIFVTLASVTEVINYNRDS